MRLASLGCRGFLVIAAMSSTGCAARTDITRVFTPRPIPPAELSPAHELYSYRELQYLSCDYKSGISGTEVAPEIVDDSTSSAFNLRREHLKAAAAAWPYALMASNVYRDPKSPTFVVPGWEPVSRWDSPSSLTLEEWVHRDSGGKLLEVAIVFKGTIEFKDWVANFSVIQPKQYREAHEYVKAARARPEYNGVRMVATGHSLGGGLALNNSLRVADVHYRGFNSSPRAFWEVNEQQTADRLLVFEGGEILEALRAPWSPSLSQFADSTFRFNFMDFILRRSFTPFKEHSMYLLARGLLLAAIKSGDPAAGRAFTANFSHLDLEKEFAERQDGARHDIQACRSIFQAYPQS